MKIGLRVDDDKWSAALDILQGAYAQKGYEASVESAELVQSVTRAKLTQRRHFPHTRTPAGEGDPPAAISGRLSASVTVSGELSTLSAQVGPTTLASSKNGAYGRIQELGGGSHGNPMRWLEDGIWYEAFFRELPGRPYLKPATDEVVASGEVEEIYVRKWEEAQLEATG